MAWAAAKVKSLKMVCMAGTHPVAGAGGESRGAPRQVDPSFRIGAPEIRGRAGTPGFRDGLRQSSFKARETFQQGFFGPPPAVRPIGSQAAGRAWHIQTQTSYLQ